MNLGGFMANTLQAGSGSRHRRAGQAWIDRCHLPLLVGMAVAVSGPVASDGQTRIALCGGKRVAVAHDLRAAVLHEVCAGELLCLRLNDGVAVTVDFVDGRPSLVSAQMPRAVERAFTA
jgi:hypothetical protein